MSAFSRLKALLKGYLRSKSRYQFFIQDWVRLGDLSRAADAMATMRFSQTLEPVRRDGPSAGRIVVVAPHPDDEILGPGGTLIRAIGGGAEVLAVYLTGGPDAGRAELRRETQEVARRVGYGTRFLDLAVRGIALDDDTLGRFAEAVNAHAPEALFVPFCLDDHDDHRRASEVLLAAWKRGLLKGAPEVWAYQVYTPLPPNVVVDVTDVIERKADAIRGWRSQAAGRDWAHFALGLNAFNCRFLAGAPGPRYAEAFFVLPLEAYMEVCAVYFAGDPSRCYTSPFYREGPSCGEGPSHREGPA